MKFLLCLAVETTILFRAIDTIWARFQQKSSTGATGFAFPSEGGTVPSNRDFNIVLSGKSTDNHGCAIAINLQAHSLSNSTCVLEPSEALDDSPTVFVLFLDRFTSDMRNSIPVSIPLRMKTNRGVLGLVEVPQPPDGSLGGPPRTISRITVNVD